MRLQARLNRLESAGRSGLAALPYVVFQHEGETLGDARARALAGRNPPPGWQFVLAPEPLSAEEWLEQHSPENPDSVQNPN